MRSDRGGFTLLEVLVAVVVLTAGVFSVAAAVRLVARLRADGHRTAGAAAAAASRFDLLRDVPCASLADGAAALPDGYDLTWQVATTAQGQRQVTIVVSYSTGQRRRTSTYVSTIPCLIQAP